MDNIFYLNCEAKGNNILLTYSQDGQTKYHKVTDYKPELFVKTHNKTNYKDLITGQNLMRKTYSNLWEAGKAIRDARDNSDYSLYGNRKFNYSFLNENFTNMEDSYDEKLIRGFLLDIECPAERGFPDSSLAEWPINLLTIRDSLTEKYNVWGLGEYDAKKYLDKLLESGVSEDDIIYHQFTEETDLLESFLSYWENNYPQYVSGWNSSTFDIPYIYNRLQRMGFNCNRLSPWNSCRIRDFEDKGREYQKVYITGIADLDYLDLYKKNRFITRPSYKLDYISEIELGVKKVDYSDIAPDLKTLWKVDWDIYTTYNIIDVALLQKLEEKLGFLSITFAVAYYAGINYGDVSSPVATWENIFYRELIKDGIILPPKKDNMKVKFEGGYVKFPQKGKHRWVCSFDLASLYPHLIMQYNISPETLMRYFVTNVDVDIMSKGVEFERKEDVVVCPTGNTFTKKFKGMMPKQMLKLYLERNAIKSKMLEHKKDLESLKINSNNVELFRKYDMVDKKVPELMEHIKKCIARTNGGQMVRKILLNSLYGALGEVNFCMYDVRLAESVTKSGQLSIRWIDRVINEHLNKAFNTNVDYVIYCDTDSVYVNLEKVVEKMGYLDKPTEEVVEMLDNFCKSKMEPLIAKGYDDLAEYTNAFEQKMFMDREVISDNSVFCAKKRYMMSVWNNEGVAYSEPNIKIMGLDVVKSSTPQVVKDAMSPTLEKILNSTEEDVQEFIKDFREKYKKFEPEQIAKPCKISSMEEKYCKSDGSFIDGNVYYISKAAIHYNRMLKKCEVEDKYEKIYAGDNVKYALLKFPNSLNHKDIAFPDKLPPEFRLNDKLDYSTMFYKHYLKPMEDVLSICGWTSEPVDSLEDLLFT